MKLKQLLLLVIPALILLAGCATQASNIQPSAEEFAPEESSSLTQVSDEAAVVVDVTPVSLENAQDAMAFQVSMNTHSVDLSYDLSQVSLLRTSQGVEIPAQVWDGPTTGGHHVSGQLIFPGVDLSDATWIEVVVMGVADVPERTFHWELNS
jgi:hypothetical protein